LGAYVALKMANRLRTTMLLEDPPTLAAEPLRAFRDGLGARS
jgi:hypothetical protein